MTPKSTKKDKDLNKFYAQGLNSDFHFLNEDQLITEEEKVAYYEALLNHYELREDEVNSFETLEKLFNLKEIKFRREKDEKLALLKLQFEAEKKEKLLLDEVNFSIKLAKKNAKLTQVLESKQRLELLLTSLQLQLSPHFIFNSMQSIQSYILQKEATIASDFLAQFARLMRAILKSSTSPSISIRDEIELLKLYFLLEAERFSQSFSYEIINECTLDIEQVAIPSLLIQPFIENAILHGVNNKEQGKITLIFRNSHSNIFVHVIDNGWGRKRAGSVSKKSQMGTSTALKILHQRAELSKNSRHQNYDFRIFDRVKNKKVVGTQVCLRISLNNECKTKKNDKNSIS